MAWSFTFFVTSALLGVGLAMDAFSVSLANGLHEPSMRPRKMCLIAGVFAGFQALMPMIGWFCVHTISHRFAAFEKAVPWIALALLGAIGCSMLRNGLGGESGASGDDDAAVGSTTARKFGAAALLVQGVATSIDALSVGFTISQYSIWQAIVCAAIIAGITFFICIAGILLGRTLGTRLGGKAEILGGCILIGIGIEIFVSRVIL